MDEMMGYIFGDLRATKSAIRYIDRQLKRQRGTNRRLGLLLLATAAYAVVTEIHHQEQKQEIQELQATIEVLRKGE